MTTAHALKAGSLDINHRDPFDRMLMAQAELEAMQLLPMIVNFLREHFKLSRPCVADNFHRRYRQNRRKKFQINRV